MPAVAAAAPPPPPCHWLLAKGARQTADLSGVNPSDNILANRSLKHLTLGASSARLLSFSSAFQGTLGSHRSMAAADSWSP